MTLKDGAIFISDSHYNDERVILEEILTAINTNKIQTTQLFLMGDMFDFLAEEISYFKNKNEPIIELINKISNNIEIIYFEGNHDFNLKDLFPNVEVIQREKQPIILKENNKTIALSHGDIYTPTFYNIYTKIIRNKYFLNLLNFIDINHWLSKKSEQNLKNKNICKKQKGFDEFIKNRIKSYSIDLIIEGHFHQAIITDNYINLPSLCCSKQYMVYQNNQFKFNMI
ncbi:MAG: UDP-2,3-diacylglucosamine diphosphatase [Campylobacterota bacterium]|nr:UDP-2,3-diacylglucosamine diphosphatase [Campylobacterota bacterium]